jgi:orotate phosphoribosyltransferase
MNALVFLAATGLTVEFIYTFLYLFYNRHSMRNGSQYPGSHRVNVRRKRRDVVSVEDIITTGDIYRARQQDDSFMVTS